MKEYTSGEPVFSETISIVEEHDLVNAENDAVAAKQLLQNDLVLQDKKVDKEDGKGLSTNDYTDEERQKLSGIASGAEVNVQADWGERDTSSDSYIRNLPDELRSFVAEGMCAKHLTPQVIGFNTDLDDCRRGGFYYSLISDMSISLRNCPTEKAFFMIVGRCYQEVIEAGPYPKRFMRNLDPFDVKTWTSWYEVYTSADTLPLASPTILGCVKTGYTANDNNYPVELDNGQMYVNVPWTDTNTWRGIQNNLTSDSSTDSLAAAQGKELKILVDEKAPKDSPVFSGSISLGRKDESVVGDCSIAVGKDVIASGLYSRAMGHGSEASGNNAHAEGYYTIASGSFSHAEGYSTTASGTRAHAEGSSTTASGDYSHAEGQQNEASVNSSHAEGYRTTASGVDSHAEGYNTTTSALASHAEGYTTTASGDYSHAEGRNTKASGESSHAEGSYTTASGSYSHTEGHETTASNTDDHAEGGFTIASGSYSHTEGYNTTASNFASHASGKYNTAMTNGTGLNNTVGDAFVIGNGTPSASSNAFRVTYAGTVYGVGNFNTSGADYAEFIKPWHDDNPDNEDRVGYFVTVKDGKLYKAQSGDYIVGITSGNPSIVGNADEDYYWRYERDDMNRIVMEDVPEMIQKTDDNGEPLFDEETHEPIMIDTGRIIKNGRMKIAADYDPSKQNDYIERKDRKEWDYVGMLGVLPVRDDGTCVVGKFCKCGKDGIATLAAERGFDTYFVIERVTNNIVSVLLK